MDSEKAVEEMKNVKDVNKLKLNSPLSDLKLNKEQREAPNEIINDNTKQANSHFEDNTSLANPFYSQFISRETQNNTSKGKRPSVKSQMMDEFEDSIDKKCPNNTEKTAKLIEANPKHIYTIPDVNINEESVSSPCSRYFKC